MSPRKLLLLALVAGCSGSNGPPSSPAGGTGGDPGGDTGGSSGEAGGRGGSGGGRPTPDAATGRADAAPPDSGALDPDAAAAPDVAPAAHEVSPDLLADALSGADVSLGAYNPCPPKGRACVALPLGDSLTQGAGSSGGGYRRELFRRAVAQGQSVTFVGSAASGPAMLEGVPVPFPRNHEGHGGFTIQGISEWIATHDTIRTYKPDIVMLEIGTNNGLRRAGANVPAALKALGDLIDQILAADARLLLIVAQITPNKTAEGIMNIQAFNAGIPALVAARAAAGKHIAIADIYKAFVANPDWRTAYLPASDVHPNDAGYDAMGRGWYGALAPLLR